MQDQDDDDEERSGAIAGVLAKAAGVVVVIALIVFIGTRILVSSLGLNDSGTTSTVGSTGPINDSPLPTTALPVPSDSPTGTPNDDLSLPSDGAPGAPYLSISPVYAKPLQRVNLTGRYPGKDNIDLQVQRMDAGVWTNFPATVTVHLGTFETYVLTSRAGDNQFRVYDPQADVGSNVVTVTID